MGNWEEIPNPNFIIEPKSDGKICASGRQGSMSGVEVKFEIHELIPFKGPSNQPDVYEHDYELYTVYINVPYLGKNVISVEPAEITNRWKTFEKKLWTPSILGNKSFELPSATIGM